MTMSYVGALPQATKTAESASEASLVGFMRFLESVELVLCQPNFTPNREVRHLLSLAEVA